MELLPRSALLTVWQVSAMNDLKIRQIFEHSYGAYSAQKHHPSDIQQKAAHAILDCKSGKLGYNISQCSDCGQYADPITTPAVTAAAELSGCPERSLGG